ncbi:hypothetical protein KIV56_11880 [Cryobacterium breve]|uniref:NADH:quinone oxidoreductase/Mrp antiporter membrane subunit domain-containing protein n=1 Tax=Cryobacterium breve TaxID=1259258 RepID=A0ABY7N9M6_9MICO|nr:hypothetical protein [Cryobacterium breve]WBM79170.1 hypothetical protein KIV56_11880 [Cryobacterium breve]
MPLALVSGTGPLARPLAVAGVSAVLLLAGCALRWTPPRSGYLAAAAASGALGLLVTSGGRIVSLLRSTEDAGLFIEAWLLPALLVLVVAGILSARSGRRTLREVSGAGDTPINARLAVRTGYGLLTVAVTFGSVAEVLSLAAAAPDETPLAAPRVVLLALACAVAHVGLIRWDRTPEGRALAWAALGGAGVALFGGYLHGVPVPLEIVTVPVGLAIVAGRLLAAGLFRTPVPATAADPGAARSTRFWIQAGLLLAILPSAIILPTPDGFLLRPILVLALGGALAIAGAAFTAVPAWRPLAWPAVSAGLVAVLLTALNRVSPLLDTVPSGPDSRLEGWLLPAAALVAATGLTLVAAARRGTVAGLAAAVGDPRRPARSTATRATASASPMRPPARSGPVRSRWRRRMPRRRLSATVSSSWRWPACSGPKSPHSAMSRSRRSAWCCSPGPSPRCTSRCSRSTRADQVAGSPGWPSPPAESRCSPAMATACRTRSRS